MEVKDQIIKPVRFGCLDKDKKKNQHHKNYRDQVKSANSFKGNPPYLIQKIIKLFCLQFFNFYSFCASLQVYFFTDHEDKKMNQSLGMSC